MIPTLGPYENWLLEHIVRAYLIITLGVILAFVFTLNRFNNAEDHITKVQLASCAAGNERSRIQKEDLVESQRMLQTIDLEKLLGVEPGQVEELKSISLAQSQKRIAAIPFVDCVTGEKIS